MSQKFVSGRSFQKPLDSDETETLLTVRRPGSALLDLLIEGAGSARYRFML